MPNHPLPLPFQGQIIPIDPAHRAWLKSLWRERWGGEIVVSRGQVHHSDELPGFLALAGMPRDPSTAEAWGAVTYAIRGAECEIVTLDSLVEGRCAGSALIESVRQAAEAAGCRRLWLVTSNDNLHALRFYQKRGFRLAAVHAGAIHQTRRLKPNLPLLGLDGIPLRDEIELELQLDPAPTASHPSGTIQPAPAAAPLPGSSGYAQASQADTQTNGDAQLNPAGTRLARRPIYESRWVNLYLDHMRTPSGFEIRDFRVIDYPNAAVAVYVTNQAGDVLLGRYPRYVIGQVRWEVPAGGVEPGEDLLAAAQREVFEETGYTLLNPVHYYTYHPTAGSTNKLFHLVRARAGERTGDIDPHEVERIRWFTVAELRQMIARRELQDGYTLTALLLAWLSE